MAEDLDAIKRAGAGLASLLSELLGVDLLPEEVEEEARQALDAWDGVMS